MNLIYSLLFHLHMQKKKKSYNVLKGIPINGLKHGNQSFWMITFLKGM